ncbi:TIGR04255 family protein [Blastopirellula marina]|nr:TIGR04255 family protein [Blastopirellula marina]
MGKREQLKLAKAPLALALVQLRFSPVLRMSKYVPDIQETLRGMGFTKYVEEQMQQLTLGVMPIAESDVRWIFGGRKRREAIILTKDFVTYEVSSYTNFEEFVARFSAALDVIANYANITEAVQIGLRYVNVIRPTEEILANDCLQTSIRGLSAEELGVTKSRFEFLIRAETECGHLLVKSYEHDGKKFIPPEIGVTHLDFDNKPGEGELFRVLDFDHIEKCECELNNEILIGKLWKLHDILETAFEHSVSREALNHWKGGA